MVQIPYQENEPEQRFYIKQFAKLLRDVTLFVKHTKKESITRKKEQCNLLQCGWIVNHNDNFQSTMMITFMLIFILIVM